MLKTPPLQTATATIDTLCGRLQSATLLEDRRAAILGLRSFAKQYPASVASGSLRELILILRRDGLGEKSKGSKDEADRRRSNEGTGDIDTIRLVLETLLMLFNPDSNSPEAGDEIAFFMADEFSMRQDNISLLLNLLDPTSPYADYYSRLYSVQLLSAICESRPERLQECILSAPLGVSRLVGVLDDGRDAVRNAGLLLLVDLTSGANEDLRKIVAFEDVFGKIFALIQVEGGLGEAGITAQDCLSLLANLIKGSSSNQTMFRESGCIAQIAHLLQQAFPPSEPEPIFLTQSREKSTFGLLQLLRLFLVVGESSTAQNQTAFFRAGLAQAFIEVGFEPRTPTPIRTSAFRCAADLIANNGPLQESFALLTVALPSSEPPSMTSSQHLNGSRSAGPSTKGSARPSVERPRTYIIEALLDTSLEKSQTDYTLRSATCDLIQAYLVHHDLIRGHFLQRAISGHAQQEQAANVLATLSQPDSDPTALLFASCIVQGLIADNLEAKTALVAVREGNESEGEDVITFIQALGSQLEAVLQQGVEVRSVAAYASLLTVFLWDFAVGIDDLLAEGSSLLQTLANTIKSGTADPLVAGLAATLLGTAYEYSTKDSPIPRRTLAPLLTQKLGRTKYLEALGDLRRQSAVRDFDFLDAGDPETILCKSFVDLFSVEYSRLRKAIDKDPGIEVLPASAAEAGVDRDVLDDLRQQLQTARDALTQHQEQSIESGQKHEQEQLVVAKELQTANAEVERLRRINQGMQHGHGSELEKLGVLHEQQRQTLVAEHQRAMSTAQVESQKQMQAAVDAKEGSFVAKIREYEQKLAEMGNVQRDEVVAHGKTRVQLEALTVKHTELLAKEKNAAKQLAELGQRLARLEKEHAGLQHSSSQATAELEIVSRESEKRFFELERVNTAVKELKEELEGKEEELKAERAGFAELEKELESARSTVPSTAADSGEAEAARHELEEAREGEKAAKDELESMLLVMADIEAKRDVYRQKVKEMGGEVTEDEEDDDEEEDEEEEDDDDVD